MSDDDLVPTASDTIAAEIASRSRKQLETDRRRFLHGAGLTAIGVVAAGGISGGMSTLNPIQKAVAQTSPLSKPAEASASQPITLPGKDPRLAILGDKPLVAETPEHLLDDDTTPLEKFFVRHNGTPPAEVTDADSWKLKIEGEVNKAIEITLADIKKKFKPVTYRMVMECGGNGRSFYQPPARGNQWTNGGAGCAEWTGVPLKALLDEAGLKPTAVYTAHYGTDAHLSGDATKVPLSRGMPIAKAMDDNTLLVWAMNGQPLTNAHGAPLRLIVPGYPGSASHKWINRIVIRDKVHDGQGMTGFAYRVPIQPMVPGGKGDEANFAIMETMPTRSIITSPANGAKLAAGTRKLALRGAAWASERDVTEVSVSADNGQTWTKMALQGRRNRFDWRRWTGDITLPSDGYYELWVRATDSTGATQPIAAYKWNPQGYGANPINRVAVLVG